VEWFAAAVLPEEEHIARQSARHIAADAVSVAPPQRLRIGKLRKRRPPDFGRAERLAARGTARPEGRERILVLRHRIDGGNHWQPRRRGPCPVVRMQRFTIGVADQRRAIVDFRGRLAASWKLIALPQIGEPARKAC